MEVKKRGGRGRGEAPDRTTTDCPDSREATSTRATSEASRRRYPKRTSELDDGYTREGRHTSDEDDSRLGLMTTSSTDT